MQAQTLQDQLDAARQKLLALGGQHAAATQAEVDQSSALAEARQQLLAMTIDCDRARLGEQEQTALAARLQGEVEALHTQLAANVPTETLEAAHRQLAERTAECARLAANEQQLLTEASAQAERFSELSACQEAAEASHAETREALAALQGELERVAQERDAQTAEIAEWGSRHDTMQEQVNALEAQLAEANEQIGNLAQHERAARQTAARFEKQRIATIDLGTRLESAQREILELSAKLAEARLMVKAASERMPRESGATASAASSAALEALPNLAQLGASVAGTLDSKSAKSALAAMRQCFQSYQKDPSDLSLLNEIYSHAYSFSERARVSGYIALHRLCDAFAHLTHQLYNVPESINVSTLRTVGQTIELLVALIRDRQVVHLRDPGKSEVYVVEDDGDTCEAITLAMETATLRTTSAQDPLQALAELEATCYDLVFLDVNLPGMNGFDLCAHIRQLPAYARTPIVFLSGMPALEHRVQSTTSGANDFVDKPFNPHELSVKALTLIVKAQLGMS